jgi:phage gp16-like protein
LRFGIRVLEAKVAQEGIILTESQLAALEKAGAKRRLTASSRASGPACAARRTPSMSAP